MQKRGVAVSWCTLLVAVSWCTLLLRVASQDAGGQSGGLVLMLMGEEVLPDFFFIQGEFSLLGFTCYYSQRPLYKGFFIQGEFSLLGFTCYYSQRPLYKGYRLYNSATVGCTEWNPANLTGKHKSLYPETAVIGATKSLVNQAYEKNYLTKEEVASWL